MKTPIDFADANNDKKIPQHLETDSATHSVLQYQNAFHQKWHFLTNSHVRNLAWVIDAPSLLNRDYPEWTGKVAQLPCVLSYAECADWLLEIDANPQPLIAFLALHAHTRLGHYAENLLAFYFLKIGILRAHGVQVKAGQTIGEFDFLLQTPNGLIHLEFACKFYLFIDPHKSLADFIGPDLRDNLDDKTHKLLSAQLKLGNHPAALAYLPAPIESAEMLIKGWLFYEYQPDKNNVMPSHFLPQIAQQHGLGWWIRLDDLQTFGDSIFVLLPRLNWLAPAKVGAHEIVLGRDMQQRLALQFTLDARPVLLAKLVESQSNYIEQERFFVVPNSWNKLSKQIID